MKLAMAIYETGRAPGGPEEGGWWFEYGHLYADFAPIAFDERNAADRAAALAACNAYIKAHHLNEGRHELNSVLCEGWFQPRAFERDAMPDWYPAAQPHYE
ncbi:MAG TPA: hypothetical protein VFQ88_15290 [Nevskiaceae bacterium]|nr:hypothetical protein [Nevskiaceae bacterium]